MKKQNLTLNRKHLRLAELTTKHSIVSKTDHNIKKNINSNTWLHRVLFEKRLFLLQHQRTHATHIVHIYRFKRFQERQIKLQYTISH